jgi:hypothetical protein
VQGGASTARVARDALSDFIPGGYEQSMPDRVQKCDKNAISMMA